VNNPIGETNFDTANFIKQTLQDIKTRMDPNTKIVGEYLSIFISI
jgi:hypothetical protein